MERRDFLMSAATAVLAPGAGAAAASAEPRTANRPLRVHVLMFDGVEEQDFAGPLEVFGVAQLVGAPITTTLVRPDRPGTVIATYGTRIEVTTAWNPRDADLLVVPGGGYVDRNGPGVHALIKQESVLRDLVGAQRSGVLVTGVCTGVMVLSAAGLTRDRPCTTHHRAKPDLAAQGGVVVDARVVDDGDLVTAGGITSGLDLALWLVTRELGAAVAPEIEAIMEYEQRGAVWRR